MTPSARALQQLGYTESSDETEPTNSPEGANTSEATGSMPISIPDHEDIASSFQVKCLSLHATIPTRATDGSAGYDLYSAINITIPPHSWSCIPLDITIIPPIGTYGQILSRSGLAAKHCVDVKASTIDRDYTGNVQVLLENNSGKPFSVEIGNCIAQLVLYNIQTPKVSQIAEVTATTRGDKGFGSMGVSNIASRDTTDAQPLADTPCIRTNAAETDVTKPYDIYFSHDPFDSTLEIDITVKGDHPTL